VQRVKPSPISIKKVDLYLFEKPRSDERSRCLVLSAKSGLLVARAASEAIAHINQKGRSLPF
jgi:hypothetical protein